MASTDGKLSKIKINICEYVNNLGKSFPLIVREQCLEKWQKSARTRKTGLVNRKTIATEGKRCQNNTQTPRVSRANQTFGQTTGRKEQNQ